MLWLALALVVVRVFAVAALVATNQDDPRSELGGDIRRYDQIAGAYGVPYKDFQVEYPPVTYALLRATHLADRSWTIAAVAITSFVFDVGSAAMLARGWSRRAGLWYLALGTPMVMYPFIYLRIDLLSVFLVTAALAFVRARQDVNGGVAFALAVLAKIWPFAIAPILIVERRVKGIVAALVSGGALLGAWVMTAGLDGPREVVSFRDATGWQVESLPGILWHMRDPTRIKFESGAWRTGVMPDWARPSLTVLSLVFVALAWWWAWRRRGEGATDTVSFGLAPLACVLALLIFAPILSPQYITWLLPPAAIVAAAGDRTLARLALTASVLSTLSLAVIGGQPEGNLYATVPVLARNLVLVAMFVLALQSLAGLRPIGLPITSRGRRVRNAGEVTPPAPAATEPDAVAGGDAAPRAARVTATSSP